MCIIKWEKCLTPHASCLKFHMGDHSNVQRGSRSCIGIMVSGFQLNYLRGESVRIDRRVTNSCGTFTFTDPNSQFSLMTQGVWELFGSPDYMVRYTFQCILLSMGLNAKYRPHGKSKAAPIMYWLRSISHLLRVDIRLYRNSAEHCSMPIVSY